MAKALAELVEGLAAVERVIRERWGDLLIHVLAILIATIILVALGIGAGH